MRSVRFYLWQRAIAVVARAREPLFVNPTATGCGEHDALQSLPPEAGVEVPVGTRA